MVAASAALVVHVAPTAGGSGVPEMMAFLNGVHLPKVFNINTLLVKFLSCALAVGSGLPVGPEGPMIHIVRFVHAPTRLRSAFRYFGCFERDDGANRESAAERRNTHRLSLRPALRNPASSPRPPKKPCMAHDSRRCCLLRAFAPPSLWCWDPT
jgi:hypothetical protein